ncbi:pyrroline-5-carboxylate reductase [Rhizobium sp. AC44/96]|uniref:pyrroline-5-carboxylate reductase family protein n=1 Tax=unclassified Rhizobium TaxID=2613769 RepID=UPI00080FBDAF|nr:MULTISPECIES: pyrroline-5-carboxylate reductase dimerization domain-containing protein [unclassified Rhizobium]MDM9620538.1 pyrroline-5-carboxylate reductase dimerization domain-containing protein [Rhizobium sp. S96]OCJ09354.1 pyrroline-5-carboxylate reductase [Rhizobium sp. AC44/96]
MGATARIGIIGGAGWLGTSIADCILAAGVAAEQDLTLSYRSSRPDRFPHAHWTSDNQQLVDRSDVVILSVRPQDWNPDLFDARGKLLISVMAGIRLSALVSAHGSERVVRALPNAAAEVQHSYTPWLPSPSVNADDRTIVSRIFAACGDEDEVQSESDLDYLTGLTGTGPAYPALLAAAMMKDAIAHGLSPAIAQRAVVATMIGAGHLFEKKPDCPDDIVGRFVDYRGVTAAGIEQMRAAGFDTAVAKGLAAALQKSVSMGDAS